MVKHIQAPPGTFVPEEVKMGGRKAVRRYLDRAEGFDLLQFEYWQSYLTQAAISAFEWEGLPAGIDPRAVEYVLLHFGIGAIFKESGGHLFTQASYGDMVNMYYNPNEVFLNAPNGATWERHADVWVDANGDARTPDCAVCFDNMLRVPLTRYINWYARRLAKYDRVADLNMLAQKTPYIVAGPEESRRTRQEVIKKLEHSEQYIEVNDAPGGMGSNLPFVLPTTAPFVADKVFESKQKVLNEALTFLGIDNTNNEKRERQVVDEVLANNEQIALMRRARLECRRSFCERANDLFGLDVNVKWGVPHLMEAPATDESAFDLGEVD